MHPADPATAIKGLDVTLNELLCSLLISMTVTIVFSFRSPLNMCDLTGRCQMQMQVPGWIEWL